MYSPQEIASLLEVGGSTLRKWCISIENEGYLFTRTSNQARVFSDSDVIILRRLKELLQVHKVAMEQASKLVVSTIPESSSDATEPIENSDIENVLERLSSQMEAQHDFNKELSIRLDVQEQFNKALLERLEQKDRYIEDFVKERDRRLLEFIRETQETRKQLALSGDTEEKKPWYKRLFKR